MSRKLVLEKLDELEEALDELERPDVYLFGSDVARLKEISSRMEKLISDNDTADDDDDSQ